MNKLFFLLLFSYSFIATSQTEKGQFLAGASSNLAFTSFGQGQGVDNRTDLLLDLHGGYFFMDDFAAGLSLRFDHSSVGADNSTSTAVGPFARFYLGSVFFGAEVAFNRTDVSDQLDNFTSRGVLSSFELGYALFYKDVVAVEPSVNYAYGSIETLEDVSAFGLRLGFTIFL